MGEAEPVREDHPVGGPGYAPHSFDEQAEEGLWKLNYKAVGLEYEDYVVHYYDSRNYSSADLKDDTASAYSRDGCPQLAHRSRYNKVFRSFTRHFTSCHAIRSLFLQGNSSLPFWSSLSSPICKINCQRSHTHLDFRHSPSTES